MKSCFWLILAAALGIAALTPSGSNAQEIIYGTVTGGRSVYPPNTFNYVAGTPSGSNAQEIIYGTVTGGRSVYPSNTFNYVAGQNYTYSGTDGRIYSVYIPGHVDNGRPMTIAPSYPQNSQNYQNPRNVKYYHGK